MKQVSLFAGVGAFELAGQRHGVETVFSCEIDKHASKVLKKHFPKMEVFNDDVRKINGRELVSRHGDIDIITAGFPCQAFSIAGKRQGFADATRGTLFFEVARLADEIRPDLIILENVKGLLNHEGGATFAVILSRLWELGFDVEWQLLNSKDFGVPQNRERVFIVGHLRGKSTKKVFPIKKNDKLLKECKIQRRPGDMATKKQRQNLQDIKSAGKYSSCGVRYLTNIEYERLNGFPDEWTLVDGTPRGQRYKQMGNSITVNVLEEIYKRITA